MSESVLLRKILIRASELGIITFRNQVGRYQLPDGRWITSGLCVGSSDLIGWQPVTITADMVGQTFARFVAIETKTARGNVSKPQARFLAAVKLAGGLATVARSVEDIEALR